MPALGVDADGWLVEDQQARPVEQSGRDVGTSLHATRIRADPFLPPVGQPDQCQRLADALLERFAAQCIELTEESEVLACGEIRVQGEILRDVADDRLGCERPSRLSVNGHLSVVGLEQAADYGDRRCLSGTVGPE